MIDRITAGILCLAMFIVFGVTALIAVPETSAEQTGTFTGSWVANGQMEALDFVEGRAVGTFNLAGNVSLKDELGEIEDFWGQCVGLSDSTAGSSVRCVWRSMKGQKAYCVLSGQPLKKGVRVTGEFVGGTGNLKGIGGSFTFTWFSVFINKDQGIFTGHTKDLTGSYRIP